ncbi:MAG TPA: hypothetical protein VGO46_18585 [Gemmatimonadaceae bacterium]|nr:hypothetical protein [Gemmatimonadaceae bacterium]
MADLMVELSVGLHKYSMYPDGHPLLESAVSGITRRLALVLAERQMIAIAVARNHLVVDGVPTDPAHAVTRDLALKLFRREIGAIRLYEGVQDLELQEMLKVIARETPAGGEESAREWEHVRLFPLTYDQLELQQDAEDQTAEERVGWASQLWGKLASASLYGGMGGGGGGGGGGSGTGGSGNGTGDGSGISSETPNTPMDPLALASAIEQRERDPEFDKGIIAFFGQFMDEIKAKSGNASNQLKRKVSTLVSALSPETLQQILKRTSPGAQRRQFMMNASHTLAADTVLDLAKAVAGASEHTMSEALLLLLTKLAKHSEKGTTGRRDKADTALRQNMRQLIDDWDGAAALPEESYWQTLEQLIAEPANDAPASSGQWDVNAEYIVQLSLEVELFSATAKHAVAEMVKQGRIAALLSMVDQTPEANTVVWTLRRHLDNTGTIRRLLRDRPIDFEVLYRLVSRVGFPAAGALLDALELEDDRTARWRLFEMLAQLGPDVGNAVMARLPGSPWYVQRNLLLLMARLETWPKAFTPLPYAKHPDPRVRREAYALLLRDPATRAEAISMAVSDTDERIVRAALNAALEGGCPREAVTVLSERLSERSLDGMMAVLAIRVITPVRLPIVLDVLVRSVLSKKRRWFFGRKLAPKSQPMLAALTALAATWSLEPQAQRVLALAERDTDPAVQNAIRGRPQ